MTLADRTKPDAAVSGDRECVVADRSRVEAYPFACEIHTRFADLDKLSHINNVAMGYLFEEGRMRFHDRIFGAVHRPPHFTLVMVQANYRFMAETVYPTPVRIGLAVGKIGRTSFSYHMGLFQDDRCTSLCDATLVSLCTGTPSPLSDDLRQAFRTFQRPDDMNQ